MASDGSWIVIPFGSQLQLQPNSIFFSPHSSHQLQLQPANSIFLSHHFSYQLQLQSSERSDYYRIRLPFRP